MLFCKVILDTFALLIKRIGAEGIQVEEVYDLDDLMVASYE